MSMNQGRIAKYELQERLGSDTVGQVWKAFDTQQRRFVAIKIIPVNAVLCQGILYSEFILWASAGEFTGVDDQGAGII